MEPGAIDEAPSVGDGASLCLVSVKSPGSRTGTGSAEGGYVSAQPPALPVPAVSNPTSAADVGERQHLRLGRGRQCDRRRSGGLVPLRRIHLLSRRCGRRGRLARLPVPGLERHPEGALAVGLALTPRAPPPD